MTPKSRLKQATEMTNENDKVEWYPMRSSYGREQKVKENLDKLGIDNYVPMTYQFT